MSHAHHRKTKTSQSGGFIGSDVQSGYQNGHGLSFSHNSNNTSSECTVGMSGSGLDNPLVIDGEPSLSGSGRTTSYSFKNLGQLHFAATSKYGHAASPVEESEAMRKWKEIKQNGFLSHPHGGIPIPLPQPTKRSNRKEKSTDHKKKMEPAKTEQEIILKTAPCSGLLSQINTGIIRRVKNYKEVHATLEALVRLEKPDDQLYNELICHVECGAKEINDGAMSCQNQFSQSPNGASAPFLDQRGRSIMAENAEERSCLEAATRACCSYKELPSVASSVIATEKCQK